MAEKAARQGADRHEHEPPAAAADDDQAGRQPGLPAVPAVAAEPVDDLVTTQHVLRTPGAELRYTVTTGRIVLRREEMADGKFAGHQAKAEVFLTAYTAAPGAPGPSAPASSGPAPATPGEPAAAGPARPVTFAFNGGPGSSSVWLHLGLLGPRRVLTGDVGALLPPPQALADNHQTLLRHSDLVFIDPVSTGYSRAAAGERPQDFHGFEGDIESVGAVIRLWTTRNGRWLAPKYLCGESYGTVRAAALARHLQESYGMYLNGLILISACLDFGSAEFSAGNDSPYPLFLPTYAAIAHYHGKHGDRPLHEVLAAAETYAAGEYLQVLARGSRLTAAERAAAAAKLASLTCLTEDYVDRVNLRPEHMRFLTELLRAERWDVSTAGLPAGTPTTVGKP